MAPFPDFVCFFCFYAVSKHVNQSSFFYLEFGNGLGAGLVAHFQGLNLRADRFDVGLVFGASVFDEFSSLLQLAYLVVETVELGAPDAGVEGRHATAEALLFLLELDDPIGRRPQHLLGSAQTGFQLQQMAGLGADLHGAHDKTVRLLILSARFEAAPLRKGKPKKSACAESLSFFWCPRLQRRRVLPFPTYRCRPGLTELIFNH